ncbi:helix-turn-helix domain-containing protein [Aurantibacillus circumpalustris]|uniref:helix-turn-helix domain-containing protein n=1 Tax=Aurantibacillus circumpalustris TaxID=3036359 RepID=UPI00295C1D3C|nr:helix-turn-helix transcriptional regulator [Aurantibacillus circumpalustris]
MAAKKTLKSVKSDNNIQSQFISHFKQVLPPGMGLAEEMADVLKVSTDSAYRRIRGETELTIDEIFKIAKKYEISVDEVFSTRGDKVTFSYTKLTDSAENFEGYLVRLISHLKTINKFENKRIYYVAEEIPIFYSFYTKKLTDFKLFYWQRSVLNIPDYQQIKFEYGIVPEHLVNLAHNSYQEYLTVPSTEVWTDETVYTGLRQIRFYLDSGILTKEIALELFAEYRKMIEMVHRNAESGRKNISDKEETYSLYNSEVVLGTNCIYIIMGDARFSYISFNTINSLTTNNPEFCDETEHWMRNLEKKSTLISGVSEKQRYQFFSQMFKRIDSFIEKAQNY